MHRKQQQKRFLQGTYLQLSACVLFFGLFACSPSSNKGGFGQKQNGQSCVQSSECISDICIKETPVNSYCSTYCTKEKACESGFNCTPGNDGKKICLKRHDKSRPLGESCASSNDCQSSLCLKDVTDRSYCSEKCETDCQGNFICQPLLQTGESVCASFYGGTGGSCTKETLQKRLNCSLACDKDSQCKNACNQKFISANCQNCLSKLATCAKENSCSSHHPKCCESLRKGCYGS